MWSLGSARAEEDRISPLSITPFLAVSTPVSRVLALLELLQTSAHALGSAELAQRLQVDRRTVRRYVAHLTALGVPVQAHRGRDGGYLLSTGYKLPPMMFNTDEAMALAIGLRAAGELGLQGIAPAVASTQAKLGRVMPAAVRQRLLDLEQTVSLGLSPASPAAMQANALPLLGAAARAQQGVRLRYRDAAGAVSQREADIYALAYRAGAWYAAGHCHLRQALRAFRLDRVESVEALPKSFLRPQGFDVQRFLTQAIASLPRAHAVEVEFPVSLRVAGQAIAQELGELVPVAGGVRWHAQADDLAWVTRLLAGLPFGFRVVRPAALRRAVAGHAEALVRQARLRPRRAR